MDRYEIRRRAGAWLLRLAAVVVLGAFGMAACGADSALASDIDQFNGQYKAEIYYPSTKLTNPPAVVWRANAKTYADLAKSCTAAKRPQAVIVTVKADAAREDGIGVWSADGKISYGVSLFEFAKMVEMSTLPVVRVAGDDAALSSKLVEFSVSHGWKDAWVLGSASVVKTVTENTEGIRGMLDCTYTTAALTDAQVTSLLTAAHDCGAWTMLCSAVSVTQEQVTYLHDRHMVCWLNVATASLPAAKYHNCVNRGADGVASVDFAAEFTGLGRYTAANSLGSFPIISGHRGTKTVADSGYPENTMEAYKWAVAQGCSSIETDIWYWNGKLAIVHNQPTASQTFTFFLDDLLSAFENTDVCIQIELKGSTTWTAAENKAYADNLMNALKDTFARHPNAKDNVIIITLRNYLQDALAAEPELAWVPQVYLLSLDVSSVEVLVDKLDSWGAMYRPVRTQTIADAVFNGILLRSYSIGRREVNGAQLDKMILTKTRHITTDGIARVSAYAARVKLASGIVSAGSIAYVARQKSNKKLRDLDIASFADAYSLKGGKVSDVSYSLVSLDGNVTVSGGEYVMNKASAVVAVACKYKMVNGKSYTVYSDAFTLKAVAVTNAKNRVTVQWRNYGGGLLATTYHWVVLGPDGNNVTAPRPAYSKSSTPTRTTTKKKHYSFKGWKSSLTKKTYKAALPVLKAASGGTTVTMTAKYTGHAHVKGAAATCTNAQKCTECGRVLKAKLGHKYKAGVCVRCGKAKKSTKIKVTSIASLAAQRIALTWKQKKSAVGYEVSYRLVDATAWETSAVKQKKAKSAKTGKKVMKKRRSAFLDGLESGQSYQVRVRLYVKSKGKRYYGKWSAVQTVSVG